MATSITYQFWSSDDAADWKGPYANIAEVPDAKYIKVRVNMSSDEAGAVPVLKDMRIEYFKRAQVSFI